MYPGNSNLWTVFFLTNLAVADDSTAGMALAGTYFKPKFAALQTYLFPLFDCGEGLVKSIPRSVAVDDPRTSPPNQNQSGHSTFFLTRWTCCDITMNIRSHLGPKRVYICDQPLDYPRWAPDGSLWRTRSNLLRHCLCTTSAWIFIWSVWMSKYTIPLNSANCLRNDVWAFVRWSCACVNNRIQLSISGFFSCCVFHIWNRSSLSSPNDFVICCNLFLMGATVRLYY